MARAVSQEDRLDKETFAGIDPVDIHKGKTEMLSVAPWVTKYGKAFVSLGIKDLGEDGSYGFYRRKGFALSLDEAKEAVSAIQAIVAAMEEVLGAGDGKAAG